MLPRDDPDDRIQIDFDNHCPVSNAELILPVTLARHLGTGEPADRHVDLGRPPGRARAGDKILPLVASAPAGGAGIDHAGLTNSAPSHRWIRANPAPKTPIEALQTPVDASKTSHRDRPDLWFVASCPSADHGAALGKWPPCRVIPEWTATRQVPIAAGAITQPNHLDTTRNRTLPVASSCA